MKHKDDANHSNFCTMMDADGTRASLTVCVTTMTSYLISFKHFVIMKM